jgi:hypothetical protein
MFPERFKIRRFVFDGAEYRLSISQQEKAND